MASNAILTIFRSFDRNGDGTIRREELAKVLRSLGAWSDRDIAELLKAVEIESDGKIQLRKFVSWVFGEEVCQQALGPAVVQQDAHEPTLAATGLPSQVLRGVSDSCEDGSAVDAPEDDTRIATKEYQQDVDLLQEFVTVDEEEHFIILDTHNGGDIHSRRTITDGVVQALIDTPGIRKACEETIQKATGNLELCVFEVWRALSCSTHTHFENGSSIKLFNIHVATSEAGAQADGSCEQDILELELVVKTDANGIVEPPLFVSASAPLTLLEDAVPSGSMQVDIDENYVQG